jgi:hypothetical protein
MHGGLVCWWHVYLDVKRRRRILMNTFDREKRHALKTLTKPNEREKQTDRQSRSNSNWSINQTIHSKERLSTDSHKSIGVKDNNTHSIRFLRTRCHSRTMPRSMYYIVLLSIVPVHWQHFVPLPCSICFEPFIENKSMTNSDILTRLGCLLDLVCRSTKNEQSKHEDSL